MQSFSIFELRIPPGVRNNRVCKPIYFRRRETFCIRAPNHHICTYRYISRNLNTRNERRVILAKILVTGASGDVGRKTLLHLLKRQPADQLIGLVRDVSKAGDLAAKGIELRQGDYFDPDSLSRAFSGVERLMLTSTHAFTDRRTAQANVIDAAVNAGVRHLVSMSIFR